jgi:hypothetical protein
MIDNTNYKNNYKENNSINKIIKRNKYHILNKQLSVNLIIILILRKIINRIKINKKIKIFSVMLFKKYLQNNKI